MAPSTMQISAAGTQPTPAAIPADSVRIPGAGGVDDVERRRDHAGAVDGAFWRRAARCGQPRLLEGRPGRCPHWRARGRRGEDRAHVGRSDLETDGRLLVKVSPCLRGYIGVAEGSSTPYPPSEPLPPPPRPCWPLPPACSPRAASSPSAATAARSVWKVHPAPTCPPSTCATRRASIRSRRLHRTPRLPPVLSRGLWHRFCRAGLRDAR